MTINIDIEYELIKNNLLNDNKSIIITITNYGYLLYTLNMLKSLKQFDLDKKVFIITIDTKSDNILKKLGYTTYCLKNNDLAKFKAWNQQGYDIICYIVIMT